KSVTTTLTLSDGKFAGNKASILYHVDGSTSDASLVVALVRKNATTKVERGENGGRTLAHVQIVSKLQSIVLGGKSSGNADIALPAGFSPEGYEIIAFVQKNLTGEITGASKVEFPVGVTANSK
ncbi:MAG TPA: DUF1223 domain-containing protein, partial [Mucilaginibacter sp.]|nr:DUF1223 domain-containing protein [Mucilaginibacter sp.]